MTRDLYHSYRRCSEKNGARRAMAAGLVCSIPSQVWHYIRDELNEFQLICDADVWEEFTDRLFLPEGITRLELHTNEGIRVNGLYVGKFDEYRW